MFDRWQNLITAFRLPTNEADYEKLIEAYSEKHRAYHTLEHLKACFRHLDALDLPQRSAAEI